MNIDMEKQRVVYRKQKCNIQKLDLTLLNMLYEKAGTCVSREEIKRVSGLRMIMPMKK